MSLQSLRPSLVSGVPVNLADERLSKMYSDVRQNSEDGSEYLVHEIRREMNVISAEAQPSAGTVLLIFGLFFLDLPSLGFHGQIPPPCSQGCPL